MPERQRPVVELLEPRVLYSADLTPAALTGGALPGPAEHRLLDQPVQTRAQELVFVDAATPDYQALINDITRQAGTGRDIEVILLDGKSDGIGQITDALSGRHDVSAVHLIAHGADGSVQLGAGTLDAQTLQTQEALIASWRDALSADADLLIYGCDVAATAGGRALMDALAGLTGADVAASTDSTGHATLGGNWDLEYHIGAIEAHLALSQEAQDEWFALLDIANLQASQDTHVVSATGNNYGASTQLIVDKIGGGLGSGHVLVQFDLSTIPVGATINSASLQMQASALGATMNVNVYQLLEGWSEGTGNGTAGAANWNQRIAATNWTTAGGTVNATAEATFNASAVGQHSWDITALVRAWFAGTQVNNGVLVASPDAGGGTITYDSREGTTVPRLVVDYTVSNVAPSLAGANGLGAINEDPASNPGTLVSALIAGRVSDPDAGALAGIAVTAVDNTNGIWQYSTNGGGVWNNFGAPSVTSARLLADNVSTLVRFVPNANWNGTVTNGLTFHAWDQTSGTAGGTADLTTIATVRDNFNTVAYNNNDGTAAWSAGWVDFDGNAGSGGIRVVGGALQVRANSSSDFIYREANLASATSAILSFDYTSDLNNGVGGLIFLQVSGNGGGSYTSIATFSQAINTGTGTISADISAYMAANTRIQFVVASASAPVKTLNIDNLQISYTVPQAGGTTAFSSATASSSITVNPFNDAPVLTPIAPVLTAITEDQTGKAGHTVASIVGAAISDIDPGAVQGVAISALNSGNGIWQYSIDGGGSWSAVGAVSNASALLLRPNDLVRFEPDTLNATSATITYRAWDQTSGAAGSKVDASTNGGTTAFSSATDTAGITVSAVNDAPVISVPGIQSTREGGSLIFSTGNGNAISLSDPDAGLSVLEVTLTAGNATLSLGSLAGLSFTSGSGTGDASMTFTGTLSAVNTALNGLSFAATPNLAGGASLQIDANDLGSTGSGGPQSATANVPVTVAGFFIDPSSGLLTGEGGGSTTFQVLLRSAPTADVTIALSSSDPTEGVVSASSLTFTAANWNVAQTVTVTGVDDFLIDGNKAYSVITGPAASGDARYSGLNPVNVSLINVDNAFVQIAVNPTSGLITTEAGGTAQFSVVLSAQPLFNVVIPLSSSDITEGTVSVGSLTFTSANWSVPQVVTVTGINDLVNDGNTAYTVILGAASSLDFSYNGLNPPDAAVTNQEVLNLAPVNAVPATQSTLEDTAIVFSAANGNAISIADADAGTNPLRVTLTAVNGVITLSGVAGLSFSAGANGTSGMTFSGTAASINTALNGLSFQPGLNFNGTAALQIGTDDQGNTGTGGAKSDFSNVDINIVAVNDAPVAVADTLAATEDTPVTYTAAQLLGNDTDVDNTNAQLSIASVTSGAGGTAVLNGGGTVTFTPSPNFNGAASFSYTTSDGAATSLPATVTVNVAPVNDAPVGAPGITGTVTENQILTADTSGISDADGLGAFSYQWLRGGVVIAGATASTYTLGNADVGTAISVVVSYTDGYGTAESVSSVAVGPVANVNDAPTGTVGISGTPTEDQVLTASNTLADADGLGPISYQWQRNGVNVAGATASTYTLGDADVGSAISVVASYTDGQGTAESVSSANVGPIANINDAPVGTANTISVLPGVAHAFSSADFGFTDPNDNPANSLLAVRITTLPGAGALTNNGVAVTAGQFVSAADIGAGLLVFTPAAGASGTGYASFSFQVQDNGGGSNLDTTARTLTINVDAVTVVVLPPAPPTVTPPVVVPPPVPVAPPPTPAADAGSKPAATAVRPSGGGEFFAFEIPVAEGSIVPPLVSREALRAAVFTVGLRTFSPVGLPASGAAEAVTELRLASERLLQTVQLTDVLRSANRPESLANEIDELRDALRDQGRLQQGVVGAVAFGSLSLTVGYVLWMVRGGVLVASVLSTLPAWRVLDPLPVLAQDDDEDRDQDAEVEEDEVAFQAFLEEGMR